MSESTKEAIRIARANGHICMINTGRTKRLVGENLTGQVEFDGLLLGCGTEIEYHGKQLMHKTFSMEDDATQVTLLRNATKNILYSVVNSNAMSIEVDGYLMPLWMVFMIAVDIIILALTMLWGVFTIRSVKRIEKQI